VREACLGDEASKRALALPAQSDARRDELEAAALHYRQAADALSGEGKLRALESLAQTYGAQRLGRSAQEEIILRELIALAPNEPRHCVYRIGGQLPPPSRAGTPRYPPAAKEAGIRGVVQAEIVVDETGQVRDARVVRSVPLLDDAALEAVREWRFEPTVVDGRPVPVRMTVTLSFGPEQ
jgi:TonB family protein